MRPPARPDQTHLSPAVRVGGAILALFGGLNLLALVLDASGITRGQLIFNLVSIALMLAGGIGLVLRRRWAWPLAAVIGALALIIGILTFAKPGDIAEPGAWAVAFYLLIVPGALLLASLFSPRTLRWLRHR